MADSQTSNDNTKYLEWKNDMCRLLRILFPDESIKSLLYTIEIGEGRTPVANITMKKLSLGTEQGVCDFHDRVAKYCAFAPLLATGSVEIVERVNAAASSEFTTTRGVTAAATRKFWSIINPVSTVVQAGSRALGATNNWVFGAACTPAGSALLQNNQVAYIHTLCNFLANHGIIISDHPTGDDNIIHAIAQGALRTCFLSMCATRKSDVNIILKSPDHNPLIRHATRTPVELLGLLDLYVLSYIWNKKTGDREVMTNPIRTHAKYALTHLLASSNVPTALYGRAIDELRSARAEVASHQFITFTSPEGDEPSDPYYVPPEDEIVGIAKEGIERLDAFDWFFRLKTEQFPALYVLMERGIDKLPSVTEDE